MSAVEGTSGFEVEEHAFRDNGEQDADGRREYDYSGTNYEFRFDGGVEMRARVYDDAPGQASFVEPTLAQVEAHRTQFRAAVDYLRIKGSRKSLCLAARRVATNVLTPEVGPAATDTDVRCLCFCSGSSRRPGS